MDIRFSELSLNHLQQAYRIARVLIVPDSLSQLEDEKEDRKLNESSKESRSIHTICFWFYSFKVKVSKFNATVDQAQVSEEDLHCISLPTNHSGLMLNFDYKDPDREFKRSIHFFWNPKSVFTYQLKMDLKDVRLVEELTRFM